MPEACLRHDGRGIRSSKLRGLRSTDSGYYHLCRGLYRYSYQSHTIFYTIETDCVFIVRVLYAGADFKRHF